MSVPNAAERHEAEIHADKSIFASNSLIEHLARGVGGIAALAGAILVAQGSSEWWAVPASLGLGAVTLILFRGCPVCWAIGLIETGYRALTSR